MARYSNIFVGGTAYCNINGRNIAVINGEVYVDGLLTNLYNYHIDYMANI